MRSRAKTSRAMSGASSQDAQVDYLPDTVGLLVSLYPGLPPDLRDPLYCQYCLGSALTSTVLFVTAMEMLCAGMSSPQGDA